MSQGLLKHGRRVMWAAALALGFGGAASAGTVIINANNPYSAGSNSEGSYGDLYAGSTNILGNGKSQAIGGSSSGWKYNDVRKDTLTGINTTYADVAVGNGSAYFHTTSGSGKSEVMYQQTTSLGGTLAELTTFGYDVFRDSDSTVARHLFPTLQLILKKGSDTKTLVWEPIYDPRYRDNPLDLNKWTTIDALNNQDGVFWSTTKIDNVYKYWAIDGPAGKSWLEKYGDYNVVGFKVAAGSGWTGEFIGGADNIRIGFNNGEVTTYNFEVNGAPMPQAPAVPEPTSIAMGLIAGVAGLVVAARRRRTA